MLIHNASLHIKFFVLSESCVFRCTLVWTSKLWFISRFWEVAYFRRPLNRKNCVGSCALVHKVFRKDQIIIYHQSKPVNKSCSSSYFIKYAFLRPNYGTHTLYVFHLTYNKENKKISHPAVLSLVKIWYGLNKYLGKYRR